jgi:hypothetical protein
MTLGFLIRITCQNYKWFKRENGNFNLDFAVNVEHLVRHFYCGCLICIMKHGHIHGHDTDTDTDTDTSIPIIILENDIIISVCVVSVSDTCLTRDTTNLRSVLASLSNFTVSWS